MDLEQRARELYDAGGGRASAPAWDQLSEVTKGVWIERVQAADAAAAAADQEDAPCAA